MNFLRVTAAWQGGALEVRGPGFAATLVESAAAALRSTVQDGAQCLLGVRPEDIGIAADGGIATRVVTTEPLGGETVVDLESSATASSRPSSTRLSRSRPKRRSA